MNKKGEKDSSWGKVADWYDELLRNDDSYQAKVILPSVLRLLEIKKGQRILDLACGQGYFSKKFTEAGAVVFGTDVSKELIELAKKEQRPDTTFIVSPSDVVPQPDASFDAAVIILALQNIEKFQQTLEEVSRVLKPGRKFLIVLNHPAFRIPKRSSWGYDEQAKIQYRRLDGYMSESSEKIDMHPGMKVADKNDEHTYSFHRPLQLYFKALAKSGFFVTRLEEWTSHKKSEKGKRSDAEDRSRIEFPLFLCLEAKKS